METILLKTSRPDDGAAVSESVYELTVVVPTFNEAGNVDGYAHAGRHRERAAYQWSVDVSAYVRADCRGRGVGKLARAPS